MASILVLGSSGMLGSSILAELQKSDNEVFFTVRKKSSVELPNSFEFNFESNDLSLWFRDKPKFDYVINCIGAIPQRFDMTEASSLARMFALNSILPVMLSASAEIYDFKIIQIATDCVFSGLTGKYLENSIHDATDFYGLSKSVGERYASGAMHLRCSILGKNDAANVSLHNWLLANKQNSNVNGYKNHYWNGITTLAFARIARGVIEGNLFTPTTQHILPSDEVTKYELVKIIAAANNRDDLQITPFDHEMTIDRTLTSLYPERNQLLWASAGYDNVPSISGLVREMDS